MLRTSLLWGQAAVQIKFAMAGTVAGYLPLTKQMAPAESSRMEREPARPFLPKIVVYMQAVRIFGLLFHLM